VDPLLEPDEELAPENIRFRLLYVPPRSLEVTQKQVYAKGRSNSLVDVTGKPYSLFIGLSRRRKLGEYLKTERKLVPAS